MNMRDIAIFNNFFLFMIKLMEVYLLLTSAYNQHAYNARGRKNHAIIKTSPKSTAYGLNSVKHKAASKWNKITRHINTIEKNKLISRTIFKKSLKEYLLD